MIPTKVKYVYLVTYPWGITSPMVMKSKDLKFYHNCCPGLLLFAKLGTLLEWESET